MTVANEDALDHSSSAGSNFDGLIVIFYAVVAVVILALICAASMSSGTAFGEIASMSVFP
jgi:hypothetical protein